MRILSLITFGVMTIVIAVMTSQMGVAQSSGGARLAGTWDTVVTIRNCATGDAIASFQSVGAFNQGGTFSGITSGTAPAARSAEQGVWEHVKSDTYRFRFKAYFFNAAGIATSYQLVTHELELNGDASSWSSSGTSEIFTMTGTPLATGCSTAQAIRMSID